MALSVIGAGFGRTGTLSIKMALEHLGLGPCHHMVDVFANPEQLPHWQAAADGQPVDWDEVFAGYTAATGWPSAHYWRELADKYPNSRILLSVRPAEHWWKSFSNTIGTMLEIRSAVSNEYFRSATAMAHKIIAEQTFGSAMNDKTAALFALQKRIDEVRHAIPSERLLIFDVLDGWEPLCKFLNLPVPDSDFPCRNSKNEFLNAFGHISKSVEMKKTIGARGNTD